MRHSKYFRCSVFCGKEELLLLVTLGLDFLHAQKPVYVLLNDRNKKEKAHVSLKC